MNDQDWHRLKEDAECVINDIDIDDMNDMEYCLYGASLAILDHDCPEGCQICREHENRSQVNSDGMEPICTVLDDFSVALSRYDDTRSEKDRTEMRKTLKRQLDAIEKELVEMRQAVHDDAAVKMFVEFRDNLKMKI